MTKDPLAWSFEHSNKSLNFVRGEKLLHQVKVRRILKTDSVEWNFDFENGKYEQ
jgi:hypothetical protein